MPPGATLAAMRSGRPASLGDLDGLDGALLLGDPADEAQGVAASSLERGVVEAQAVVDDRPPTARPGWVDAWLSLMATSPRGAIPQERVRPRQVEPTVEGRHDGDRARRARGAGSVHSRCEWIRSNSSARSTTSRMVSWNHGARVAEVAGRAQGLGDRGDVATGDDRIAGREGRDLVAAPVELDRRGRGRCARSRHRRAAGRVPAAGRPGRCEGDRVIEVLPDETARGRRPATGSRSVSHHPANRVVRPACWLVWSG